MTNSQDTKLIKLNQGKFAIVDIDDYEWLSQYKWYVKRNKRNIYASTHVKDRHGKYKTVGMHRLIMNNPKGLDIDHKNTNGLDNRKSNLRACTRSQNSANRRLSLVTNIKLKGVTLRKSGRYRSRIAKEGKIINLGTYETPEEAHEAYKNAAIEKFGEFARFE